MYSALKQRGQRLYELARRGVVVEREPRRVTIFELTLERYEWPDAEMYVRCSKGTYVRSLVVDLAAALGTVAHVAELRRVAVEPFGGEPMATVSELEALAASGGTDRARRAALAARPRARGLARGSVVGRCSRAACAWPIGGRGSGLATGPREGLSRAARAIGHRRDHARSALGSAPSLRAVAAELRSRRPIDRSSRFTTLSDWSGGDSWVECPASWNRPENKPPDNAAGDD